MSSKVNLSHNFRGMKPDESVLSIDESLSGSDLSVSGS